MSESSASALPTYRIDLAYDGATFQGWQSQLNHEAIQDHIEAALQVVLRHPVRLTGAARTDSGVHAQHQVAVFQTDVEFVPEKWSYSLQGLLPKTIGVLSITRAPPGFHPITSATGKVYRYLLWRSFVRQPFLEGVAWRIHPDCNVELMARNAKALIGTHDFAAFCGAGSAAKTTTRTIYDIQLVSKGALCEMWFAGEGFLKHQIRNMVGTLVAISEGKRPDGCIPSLIAGGDRTKAGMTAPAHGLNLMRIFYDGKPDIATIREAASVGYCVNIPS